MNRILKIVTASVMVIMVMSNLMSLKCYAKSEPVKGSRNMYIFTADLISDRINSYLIKKSFEIKILQQKLTGSMSNKALRALLKNEMSSDKNISDVYMGFENNAFIDGGGWNAPKDYNVTQRPWYTKAKASSKPLFIDPFIDISTGKYIVTVAAPVKGTNGKLKGVISEDFYIDEIADIAYSADIIYSCTYYLRDSKGTLISSSDKLIKGTNNYESESMKPITEKINSKGYDMEPFEYNGYIYIPRAIKSTGWMYILCVDKYNLN